jgi:hypothetical protein
VEERVVGIVYHSGESDKASEHSHEMYLVTWDGRVLHIHNMSGTTSYDAGHFHRYIGSTEPAPSGVPHTHGYYTVTTFNDGHDHVIRGRTGPAIELPGGGHFHFFEGTTSVNGRTPHFHHYAGRTTSS